MLILKERGVPVPSPSVVERLRLIDATFDIKPFQLGDAGFQWAAVCPWPLGNPKWARVQSGEIDPSSAFDIVAWIPLEVSVEQIPGFVERGLVGLDVGDGYEHIRSALTKIRLENQKAPEQRWQQVEDKAMELFETFASKVSPDVIRVRSIDMGTPAPAAAKKAASKSPSKARKKVGT